MNKLIAKIPYFKLKKEKELQLQWKKHGEAVHGETEWGRNLDPAWTEPLKEGIPIKPITITETTTAQLIKRRVNDSNN